jgi:hypothetical protein
MAALGIQSSVVRNLTAVFQCTFPAKKTDSTNQFHKVKSTQIIPIRREVCVVNQSEKRHVLNKFAQEAGEQPQQCALTLDRTYSKPREWKRFISHSVHSYSGRLSLRLPFGGSSTLLAALFAKHVLADVLFVLKVCTTLRARQRCIGHCSAMRSSDSEAPAFTSVYIH